MSNYSLAREFRLSYIPPLMVYLAAGISTLTHIVGAFFVKDHLDISAEFLAALGFWITVPWMLKMPLGHLVDILWRYKSVLVYLGASLIAISLLIMIALLSNTHAMKQTMPIEAWYVISVLLAPIGYVVQDVVADAMTVEAIPTLDNQQQKFSPGRLKSMHVTMQTLGRVAIIGGSVFVAILNIYVFSDAEKMQEAEKIAAYIFIYQVALLIPIISILGVILAAYIKRRHVNLLVKNGYSKEKALSTINLGYEPTHPDWWILGGSLVFILFTLILGLSKVPMGQEIIFIGSLCIILFLMRRLLNSLDEYGRRIFIGTAAIIFMFRAIPRFGPGETWWMIDALKFDQHFLSILSLIGSLFTLLALFIFRRFMAEKSIATIIGILTIAVALLSIPNIGMYHGLHEWTSSVTNSVVDARFLALVDTAAESPLMQIAMIPMLAWIAHSAPANLKATFFAVMASFANLSFALSQLITKYLYQIFTVTREVKDAATGQVKVAADYSNLGMLMVTATIIGIILPLATIYIVKRLKLSSG